MPGGSYMGGIAEAVKFEDRRNRGRKFGLIWTPAQVLSDGDLGRGGSETTMAFFSEEGRGYFIQLELMRERAAELAQKLEWAERALKKIEEKRERRRKARLVRLGRV